MKKKKILFITPLPPPHYGSALSSEMCLNILENSKKFEVRNIKINYSKKLNDIGKINFSKIKGYYYVKNKIIEEMKDFKPDIVYFVPATSSKGLIRDYLLIKEIKKRYKKKIILHIRSRILEKDWKNIFKKKIIKGLLKDTKAIVLGESLVKDLHNTIDEKDIFILPNAIKNEVNNKEIKKILKERENNLKLKILFLSNLERSKGWIKVLETCKILNDLNEKFECNFVGEWKNNKDMKYFNNFVEKNKLQKNVFYRGKKVGFEKSIILQKTDILIFPTEYPLETFGRVIIEGMMYAIPVIANSIATIPEIIENNKTGILLEINDSNEIFCNVMKLKNKKLRKEMGINGRKRFLKRYEIKNYQKKFLEILSSI